MMTWDALQKARERDAFEAMAIAANARTITVGMALADAVRTLELLAEPVSPVMSLTELNAMGDVRPRIAADAVARAYDALGGYPFTDPR